MSGDSNFLLSMHKTPVRDRATRLPLVARRFEQRSSGLFAPEGTVTQVVPLDQIKVYLTAREVFGFPADPEMLLNIVDRTSFEATLVFVANLLRLGELPGNSVHDVDDFFVNNYLPLRLRNKVRALLANSDRVLIVPQLLYVLLKLSAAKSDHFQLPSPMDGSLPYALIALSDFINAQPELDTQELNDTATLLRGTMVSAGHFYSEVSVMHSIGRFFLQWIAPSEELTSDPRYVDLKTLFEEHVGVDIEDLMLVALILHARTVSSSFAFTASYLQGVGLEEDKLAVVMSLLCISRVALQEAVATMPEADLNWNIDVFERFPVVRLDEERYLIVSPNLILRRVFSFLPVFDLRAACGREAKLLSRVNVAVALAGEVYATDTLRILADQRGATFFNEAEVKNALGGEGKKTCDVIIGEGTVWTLIEITSSQLRRESVAGTSEQALDADLDKLVKKLRQLDATVQAMRRDISTLGGPDASTTKFNPVLLLTEGFPVNPLTVSALRDKAASLGLLQGGDLTALEVLDLVDLEMIEGLEELPRPAIYSIVADKQASSWHAAGMRDYLLLSRRATISTPTRVLDAWNSASQRVLDRLPPEGEHP